MDYEASSDRILSAPSSLPGGLNSRFGSELTLTDCGSLSECQSEADLRYYDDSSNSALMADDRSVVSDGRNIVVTSSRLHSSHSKSAGNLRLGILPENRTINFQEPGIVYKSSRSGMQIKSYGLIDDDKKGKGVSNGGSQINTESGYSSSSDGSRASPRASLDGESRSLTPPPSTQHCSTNKSGKAVPPKKPVRTSKIIQQQQTSRSKSLDDGFVRTVKDYKMVRLAKDGTTELGIIIAKKKLKDLHTTGFHIVHIEPGGLVDK